MAFSPASSLAFGTVTVAGTVAVSNFPATQPVSGVVGVSAVAGVVAVDASGFSVPVTGPLTDTQIRATPLPVSGTVTANQGAGGPGWAVLQATDPWHVDASSYPVPVTVNGQPISVDASGMVVPVSVASLPLPAGAATEATLARVNGAVQDSALTAIIERERIDQA